MPPLQMVGVPLPMEQLLLLCPMTGEDILRLKIIIGYFFRFCGQMFECASELGAPDAAPTPGTPQGTVCSKPDTNHYI